MQRLSKDFYIGYFISIYKEKVSGGKLMLGNYIDLIRLLEDLGRKWSFYILLSLFFNETLGFNELKKIITPISSRTLAVRLKDLEKFGLVTRKVLLEFPKRVEYRLTENGKQFMSFIIHFFNFN